MPFFITSCGRGGLLNEEDGETVLMKGANDENLLYIPSMHASKSQDEIANSTAVGQVYFQQFYNEASDDVIQAYFDSIKAKGGKAIAMTIDSAGDGDRWRAARWDVGSSDSAATYMTWDYYAKLRNMTDLPIILKGITTVEDAKLAIEHGAAAIYLSNHGARQLDGSPSGFETALEM